MTQRKKLSAAQRRKVGLPLHLSLAPQHIRPDEWYYEEPKHIDVVAWVASDRAMSAREKFPIHIKIPWHSLAKSLKRYRAYKRTAVGKDGGRG